MIKVCNKCNQELELFSYSVKESSTGKLSNTCKSCTSEYSKQHYQNSKDKRKLQMKEWGISNRDKRNEIAKRYRVNNPDKAAESQKKWKSENKEHLDLYHKEYFSKEEKRDKRRIRNYINGLKNYGLTLEEYESLVKEQNNQCKICSFKFKSFRECNKPQLIPQIDHCHTTGKVRGLLCTLCNISLGGFKDNINTLQNAIKYLTQQ